MRFFFPRPAQAGAGVESRSMKPPLLALTMGDAAGIGPEVIAAAWPSAELHRRARPLVVGHPEVLRRAVRLVGAEVEVVSIGDPLEAAPSPALLPCLWSGSDDVARVPLGRIDARAGEAAFQALITALDFALAGRVAGLVTAPLNKKALWLAGHRYPGHTEILAERCGVPDHAMMLYLSPSQAVRGPAGLGVVHVTLHVGLAEAIGRLTTPAILGKIELADQVFRRLDQAQPRIGVAALNPHGGEQGLFGDEESRIIAPAVRQAQARGLAASGPWPADTLMVRARDGEFDAVVAMVHDQGHIALKLLGMHQAVNITLGLPIVRTSVAHGTAFDLAGTGKAEWRGLIEAVRLAAQLIERPA